MSVRILKAKRSLCSQSPKKAIKKRKPNMDESSAPVPRTDLENAEPMDADDDLKEVSDSDSINGWGSDGDDGDDWGDIDENDDPQQDVRSTPNVADAHTYQILDPESLAKLRKEIALEVIDALFPDNDKDKAFDMAVSLLQQFGWNKSKVINTFVCDPEAAFKKAGIGSMGFVKADEKKVQLDEDGLLECPQCYEDVKTSDCFSLECRHLSCRDCWVDYLSFNTKQGSDGVVITCNYPKCNLVVAESAWAEILPASLVKKREKFVLDHFVSAQKDLVWCPGPNCPNAIKDPMLDSPEVHCTCDTVFCFMCQEQAHRPCQCKFAKQWLIKCSSEAENATWILANTKRCPKCQTQIEKNQGCNHMTCRHCKHEFCWLCKGDWKNHGSATGGYYRCNRYEESKKTGSVSEEESKAQSAKNELQKYLHYFQRFDNHMKARKFAEKSLDRTMNRMKNLQELKGGGFNDVSFLDQAVKTVIVCRQLLQWTYAMGYYMPSGTKEKDLFEHLQEELEKNTEYLHELSEKPLEDLIDEKARSMIINYTRVTNKFRQNLMKGIENGLTTSIY